VRAKINLSQTNQGLTFQFGVTFAHLSRKTPIVKLRETRVSPFNHAPRPPRFGKSADPACYNVPVGGNSAATLFDMVRQ